MKTLLVVALCLLTGCAAIEGKQRMNDPDCKFSGKPNDYTLPPKCCPCGYGSVTATVNRIGPNTYEVRTIK
jgi:hypothetical protein